MTGKRNNMIPNVHFHKDWQRYIKTWFNQPARKQRRYKKRQEKARKLAPRPVGLLRPIVRCPSVRYNIRGRLGKGFTLPELKAAGICKKEAMKIGVSVDYKRKNRSAEGQLKNIQRLKEYKSKLILFPISKKKPKKADSSVEECKKAQQLRGKVIMPLRRPKKYVYSRVITAKDKKFSPTGVMMQARMHAKTWGIKAKRAKARAEDAAVNAKK